MLRIFLCDIWRVVDFITIYWPSVQKSFEKQGRKYAFRETIHLWVELDTRLEDVTKKKRFLASPIAFTLGQYCTLGESCSSRFTDVSHIMVVFGENTFSAASSRCAKLASKLRPVSSSLNTSTFETAFCCCLLKICKTCRNLWHKRESRRKTEKDRGITGRIRRV